MLKHYVEFYYPGLVFSENECEEIAERKHELVKLPKGAYGYRFFDREEVATDGEVLKGEIKNHSGMVYYGKIYTLEDVKDLFPECKILIGNMERNRFDRVVRTCTDNWQPFYDGDTVIEC